MSSGHLYHLGPCGQTSYAFRALGYFDTSALCPWRSAYHTSYEWIVIPVPDAAEIDVPLRPLFHITVI